MEKKDLSFWEKIADRLEASRIAEYVELSQKPGRMMWRGFLLGIARGLGFTLGTAIVIAVIYKILSKLISMNIPYLTEMLTDLVLMIKGVH